MSTETDQVTSYPLSEIPEFIKKQELSVEELEYQCHKLREENHQLQLRILGVNELARLLQDRNEVVAMLKEKNKRLEVSVVRLENRCANFERQIKSQKNSGVASVKAGQSPFIPGPSKQILENLMQENIELKKTVNSLQKKGSSGYLEAVKTTQLEEFIEQQKMEIDQLRGQINNLTTGSGEEDEVGGVSSGGGMSLPATVTEHGPLRRQLIKMQKTMAVKDRFCTLLSQQVTELQRKLNRIQNENSNTDKSEPRSEHDGSELSQEKHPTVETGPSGGVMDTKKDLSFFQKQLEDKDTELRNSMDKMSQLQNDLQGLVKEKDDLREKLQATTHVYSTLLADNAELRKQLERRSQEGGAEGEGGPSGEVESLNNQVINLQKLMDEQVQQYSGELRSKDNELNSLRALLEETQVKFVTTESELMHMKNEAKQKQGDYGELTNKILDLEEDIQALKSVNEDQMKTLLNKEAELKKYKATGSSFHDFPTGLRTGGLDVPKLIEGSIHGSEGYVKDGLPQGLKARGQPDSKKPTITQSSMQPNPSTPFTSSAPSPQSSPHISKPGPLNLKHQGPPNTYRSKSPVHQSRSAMIPGHPQQYPPTTLHTPGTPHTTPVGTMAIGNIGVGQPMTRPPNMSPSGLGGPMHRNTSAGALGSHGRYSSPLPVYPSYSAPPGARTGPPGNMMGGHAPNFGGTPGSMRYLPPSTTMSSSVSGPPPIPPRNSGYNSQISAPSGQHQQFFMQPPPSRIPAQPNYQQFSRQQPANDFVTSSLPVGMSSLHSEQRERGSSTGGSTSPAPLHRPSTPHDGGNPSPSSMHPPYGPPGPPYH